MVSTLAQICTPDNLFLRLFVIVPNSTRTRGNTIILTFFYFHFRSRLLCRLPEHRNTITYIFFLFSTFRSDRLLWIRGFDRRSKLCSVFCISFPKRDLVLCYTISLYDENVVACTVTSGIPSYPTTFTLLWILNN